MGWWRREQVDNSPLATYKDHRVRLGYPVQDGSLKSNITAKNLNEYDPYPDTIAITHNVEL
jgi:hypothetical protein